MWFVYFVCVHIFTCYYIVDLRACLCVSHCRARCLLGSTGSMCGGRLQVGSGKGSNHKYLNLQMALMSCAKHSVLTDEPVNPGWNDSSTGMRRQRWSRLFLAHFAWELCIFNLRCVGVGRQAPLFSVSHYRCVIASWGWGLNSSAPFLILPLVSAPTFPYGLLFTQSSASPCSPTT